MKATPPRVLACALFALLLAACGDDDPIAPGGGVVLDGETVVVDSTVLNLVSTDDERAAGVLRFLPASGAPDLAVGDVLVGAEGGGFLRRISGLSTAGDTVVATTVQASLTDAIEHGELEFRVPLSLGPSLTQGGGSAEAWWGPARVTGTAPGVTLSPDGLVLDGTQLISGEICSGEGTACVSLALTIPAGRVDLQTDLDIDLVIENSAVSEFHAVASGTAILDADLALTASARITHSGERTLATYERPFYAQIGPVPVVGVAVVDLVAGYGAEASVSGTILGGITGSSTIRVGAHYEQAVWTDDFGVETTFGTRPVTWEAEMRASVRVGIKPVVTLFFYFVAGPYLEVEPYLALASKLDIGPCTFEVDLAAGLDAGVGFLVEIFDEELADYSAEFPGPATSLYDYSEQLPMERCVDAFSFAYQRNAYFDASDYGDEIYVDGVRVTNTTGVNQDPDWSPDGARIAFSSSQTDDYRIFVIDADGGNPRAVSPGSMDQSPAWSPDGSRIAYSGLGGFQAHDIHIVDADGRNRQRITTSTYPDFRPRWHPDGSRIVYTCGRENNSRHVCVVNADGTGGQLLIANADYPDWSRDGGQLVYVSTMDGGIHVANADGSGAVRVLDAIPGYEYLSTRWSRTGLRIAFSRILLEAGYEGYSVMVMNADGTEVREQVADALAASWHP